MNKLLYPFVFFCFGFVLIFFIQCSGTFNYSYDAKFDANPSDKLYEVQMIKYKAPLGAEIITDGKGKNFKSAQLLTLSEKSDYFFAAFSNQLVLALLVGFGCATASYLYNRTTSKKTEIV